MPVVREVKTPLLAAGGLCRVRWVGSFPVPTGSVCKLAFQYLKKEKKGSMLRECDWCKYNCNRFGVPASVELITLCSCLEGRGSTSGRPLT